MGMKIKSLYDAQRRTQLHGASMVSHGVSMGTAWCKCIMQLAWFAVVSDRFAQLHGNSMVSHGVSTGLHGTRM